MNDQIIACLYAAVDESNRDRPGEPEMAKSPDAPIHGADSVLDSLGLINFIVAVEENVEREFGVELVLADDHALERESSPFQTIATLADYVEELLVSNGS
jgi:acyl carrier protein